MNVSCSDTAIQSLRQIAAGSPEAYVEIGAIIQGIHYFGLAGETGIAVLNHQFDVYLLEPALPGVPILVVSDPTDPKHCVMADVGNFSAASRQCKMQAATAAAAALGIVLTDIYIVS